MGGEVHRVDCPDDHVAPNASGKDERAHGHEYGERDYFGGHALAICIADDRRQQIVEQEGGMVFNPVAVVEVQAVAPSA